MKHRDFAKRIVKTKGGEKETIRVERMMCQKCGHIIRILPSYISPHKHYENEVIEGVVEGLIDSDTLGYENYPNEKTMERWRRTQK